MSTKFKPNFLKIAIIAICLLTLLTIGREVFYRHFFNTQLTTIPDVTSLNKKDAVDYLKNSGLKIKVINSKTEKVGLNQVFIQFPTAGRVVKVNRTIQIWVNSGEGQEVPNIVGLELLEARSKLQGDNIQIQKIDYLPSNQKYNTILGVYPAPGTKLEINQKISILVSSRMVTDPSVMPNLIGLDINDARVLLAQIGLTVSTVNNGTDATLPVNTIISTNPTPGAKVVKGQKITIIVNSGVVQQQQGPSVEQIINETNEEINNKDIESIIDDTLKKIEQKETDKNTTPTAPATPETPKQ
jgi:beta-lactam-binding protein with PASTA domain